MSDDPTFLRDALILAALVTVVVGAVLVGIYVMS